jgi:hypothetical protein
MAVAATATAQQTNTLDTCQQTYEKRQQSILAQYGKTLDTVMADLKKKGDLDNLLILQAEGKRFDAEKTVPAPNDAMDSFRPATEAYYQTMVALLEQYTKVLDGLIKKEVVADRIEEAKAVKTEKDKASLLLADMQSKLPVKDVVAKPKPENPDSTPPDKAKVPLKDITPTLSRKITIPANSEGISIGRLDETQTLALQYVSGTWGDGGALSHLSPDDLNTQGGCRLRLVGPDTSIIVPYRTKRSPFTFKVLIPGEYFLRTDDGSPADNPGKVIYRVSTSKE